GGVFQVREDERRRGLGRDCTRRRDTRMTHGNGGLGPWWRNRNTSRDVVLATSPAITKLTTETDSPAEGAGFEPSVPRRGPSVLLQLNLLHFVSFPGSVYSDRAVPRSSGGTQVV